MPDRLAANRLDCPDLLPVPALDAATQAIAITDAPPNRKIVFANKAFCRLTGYRLEEILGNDFNMFASPMTERSETVRMREAVAAGHSVTASVTCQRKDGTLYRIRTHVCPITDDDGEISHWISFQKDISAEDETLARLQETTERLEATIEATGDGVWDWDIQSGTLYWSDTCLGLLGLERHDFDGRIETFIARVHPEDRVATVSAIRAHLTHREPFAQSLRLLHAQGHAIEVMCKGRASWDHTGTALRMVGTISDLSELALSNRRLMRTEQMARIGNWDLTLQSRAMHWSPEMYRILGADPEVSPPCEAALLDALHPDDRPDLERALAAGIPFSFEARLRHLDGSESHVQLAGDGVRDHAGRLLSVFGMMQDITRRKQQEIHLQRARKMEAYGQMAGGVAHDFNNLLAVIMGNLELLQEARHDPDLSQTLIRDALRAVERGRDLTGSLLNFTHKAVLQPRRVNVTQTLNRTARIMSSKVPGNVGMSVHCDPAAADVHVDPSGLETCLVGLVMNAADALAPRGGTIRLMSRKMTALAGDPRLLARDGTRALPPGSYVQLSVADDGPGIRPEHMQRIFEPFFTTKGVGKGSGLGLSRICGFAEQSGGTVLVESALDAGTIVSVILPAA